MRSRVLVAAVTGLLGLALAGCGTGQGAPTSNTLSSIPGVNADGAGVAVRNARVPFAEGGYPAGGDAPVELTVVNTGTEPLRLVEQSSPAAGSVTVASVELVGVAPDGTGVGNQLRLPPGGLANATLTASGLVGALDGTVPLPVTLVFDNGAELDLELPTAPPEEPLPREPMILDEEAEAEGH